MLTADTDCYAQGEDLNRERMGSCPTEAHLLRQVTGFSCTLVEDVFNSLAAYRKDLAGSKYDWILQHRREGLHCLHDF